MVTRFVKLGADKVGRLKTDGGCEEPNCGVEGLEFCHAGGGGDMVQDTAGGMPLRDGAGEEVGKPGGNRGLARDAEAGEVVPVDHGCVYSRPERKGRENKEAVEHCRSAGEQVGGATEAVAGRGDRRHRQVRREDIAGSGRVGYGIHGQEIIKKTDVKEKNSGT